MQRSYEGIQAHQSALEVAEQRARAHPDDLAPPYILPEPYRVVAPFVTDRGRELAAPPLAGVYRTDGGANVAVTIAPEVKRVRNSLAALSELMEEEPGPIREEGVHAMGVEPELNRVRLIAGTFTQDLRHRLAQRYGRR